MDIDSLQLVYFSPTGTTQKVLENIAAGMKLDRVEQHNLTIPGAAKSEDAAATGGLTIIGAPVYGGRLPLEAVRRFGGLSGKGMPAVVVAVYGNRDYEDALLELKILTESAGFRPVAGGVFLGEHSYSTQDMPIAAGRPDATDVNQAQEFGKKIRELLAAVDSVNDLSPLQVPGNFPLKERGEPPKIAPLTDETLCTKCELCIPVCPTQSITLDDTVQTDPNTCIRCCACIKACPPKALYFDDPGMRQITQRLYTTCTTRKEPEMYLSRRGH
jgi:ferredoxin